MAPPLIVLPHKADTGIAPHVLVPPPPQPAAYAPYPRAATTTAGSGLQLAGRGHRSSDCCGPLSPGEQAVYKSGYSHRHSHLAAFYKPLTKNKKGAVVAHGPSLGRKRPRSALQQSLAALQHIMNRLVRSRGVLPGRRTGWNGGTRIPERNAPIWNREVGCGAEGTLS